jgi:hypothetical protein
MRFIRNLMQLAGCILAVFALTSVPVCYGQNVSGMTGVVTDQSGAVVPNAAVSLSNSATGLKFTQSTNSLGVYRFSNIPPGQGYQAVYTAAGFAPLAVKEIYLTVGTIRTQNAKLTIGSRTEMVEVTATNSEVTVDTSDAIIGNTFDVQALNELPVQQRDSPTALFKLQPGVTESGAVTGARVDQNYVTLDGLDVNDFATGGAAQDNTGPGVHSGFSSGTIVASAPIDSVQEFHGNVAGVQADTGAASGGQFALVTKSGTNSFHGNINEYHRDPSLVANSWFSNNASPKVPRNHLIENQFGGNIGGPIKRNKMFFFFNFNESRIIRSSLVQRTVPLDTLRADNPGGPQIGYINSGGGTSYISATQAIAMDPAGIGIDMNWINTFSERYPHSNNNITGDGVNSGGYSFNAPFNDNETNYVGRIDYNISDKMKLYGRFSIDRENAVDNPNEFGGDPVSNPIINRSYAFVIGHNWVIGSTKTNRVFLGETVQKLSFPNTFNPLGSTFFTFSNGTGPALASSLYLNPSAQARRIPIPMIGDDFTWTKGTHTWQWGGTFKNILAHNTNTIDYNTVEIGPGGNVFSLCGPAAGECGTTGGVNNPSLRPADINTTTQADEANYDWDQAFTFMLAHIAQVAADFNYNAAGNVLPQLTGDQRFYRYRQLQLYAQDAWKLTPNLTVSYGVTYQWFSVPYETRGLESVEPYTFDKYLQARIAQSSASLSGPGTVPLIAYYLGGKANKGGLPLYQPEYRNFSPHVGFAWVPWFDKKMVLNTSGSVVYDRTVINALQFIQDQYSYLFQQTKPFPSGISGDPWNSLRIDPRLDSNSGISAITLTPPNTPRPPYQPYNDASVCGDGSPLPCGLQLGYAFNSTIDPSLKTPYSITFNAGMQRTMPGDMVLKLSYAGRLGRRLVAQADSNQVLEFPDPVSGQLLSDAFGNLSTQLREGATADTIVPQPWFENMMSGIPSGYTSASQFLVSVIRGLVLRGDFGDTVQVLSYFTPQNVGSPAQFSENTFYGNKGSSNYHALLLTLQKNTSHGLHFDFNYTLAHSIDNVSFFANSMGDTGIGGIGLICDVVRPRACRSSSDFDIRHYINGDVTYELPFGKNKMFLGTSSKFMNELIGGWSISGIPTWHTGVPWSNNANAFDASYSNNAPGILVGSKSDVATHLTKKPGGGVNIFADQAKARAAYIGPVGFNFGARNSMRGPKYFNTDLGVAKTFPVYHEKVNFKFRADAFNALNHPNFDVPANNVYNGLDQQDFTSSTFGNISYTLVPEGNLNNGARVLQLSLRLEF